MSLDLRIVTDADELAALHLAVIIDTPCSLIDDAQPSLTRLQMYGAEEATDVVAAYLDDVLVEYVVAHNINCRILWLVQMDELAAFGEVAKWLQVHNDRPCWGYVHNPDMRERFAAYVDQAVCTIEGQLVQWAAA